MEVSALAFEVPNAEPRTAQPWSQVVTRMTSGSAASRARSAFDFGDLPGSSCGKGRIPGAMQANNQRNRDEAGRCKYLPAKSEQLVFY